MNIRIGTRFYLPHMKANSEKRGEIIFREKSRTNE